LRPLTVSPVEEIISDRVRVFSSILSQVQYLTVKFGKSAPGRASEMLSEKWGRKFEGKRDYGLNVMRVVG